MVKKNTPIGPKTLHRLMVLGEDLFGPHLKELNEAVQGIEGKERVSLRFNALVSLAPKGGVAMDGKISFATQRIRDQGSVIFDEAQGELFDDDDPEPD